MQVFCRRSGAIQAQRLKESTDIAPASGRGVTSDAAWRGGDAWRGSARYDALRGIDRAGLMWEWLRRDEDYIAWYATASRSTRATGTPAWWGLHFR